MKRDESLAFWRRHMPIAIPQRPTEIIQRPESVVMSVSSPSSRWQIDPGVRVAATYHDEAMVLSPCVSPTPVPPTRDGIEVMSDRSGRVRRLGDHVTRRGDCQSRSLRRQ